MSELLREHAVKIINLEKRKMLPLTDEQQKSYEKAKICVICKMSVMPLMIKKYWKVRDNYRHTSKYRGAAQSIYNLKYGMPIELPLVFQYGLNYGYHFIIKDQAREFEWELNFLGEHTKKYKIYTVPITKGMKRIDKYRNKIRKISYKITIYWLCKIYGELTFRSYW